MSDENKQAMPGRQVVGTDRLLPTRIRTMSTEKVAQFVVAAMAGGAAIGIIVPSVVMFWVQNPAVAAALYLLIAWVAGFAWGVLLLRLMS